MEEQDPSVQNSSYQSNPINQSQIAAAIVIAGLIIGGAVLLRGNMPARTPTNTAGSAQVGQELTTPITEDDHWLGNPNAGVVVVEYSDLECPFCKNFHGTMHQIVTDYDGEVAWVYRHYPIPQLHAKAIREAEATECAWDQGGNAAFWAYTDRIFELTTSNDGLPDSALPQIAGELGLNVAEFNSCLNGGNFADKVTAHAEDALKMNVRGTPGSFIVVDGEVVDTIAGALPYAQVKTKIDAALR